MSCFYSIHKMVMCNSFTVTCSPCGRNFHVTKISSINIILYCFLCLTALTQACQISVRSRFPSAPVVSHSVAMELLTPSLSGIHKQPRVRTSRCLFIFVFQRMCVFAFLCIQYVFSMCLCVCACAKYVWGPEHESKPVFLRHANTDMFVRVVAVSVCVLLSEPHVSQQSVSLQLSSTQPDITVWPLMLTYTCRTCCPRLPSCFFQCFHVTFFMNVTVLLKMPEPLKCWQCFCDLPLQRHVELQNICPELLNTFLLSKSWYSQEH